MDSWLWTPLSQHVSRIYNCIRNNVDSPGGNPEIETELANATVETTGWRGATTGDPTWGSNQVVTTQLAGGAHPVMEAVVTSTTEDAQRH